MGLGGVGVLSPGVQEYQPPLSWHVRPAQQPSGLP